MSLTDLLRGFVSVMVSGIDRLERLFSKKKQGPSRLSTATNMSSGTMPASTTSDCSIPRFPQTPYIRPKMGRMVARDESVCASTTAGRSQSLPDASSPKRMSTFDPHEILTSRSDYCASYALHMPSRTSSLLGRRDSAIASLSGFQFNGKDGGGGTRDARPVSPTSSSLRSPPPRLSLGLGDFQDLGPIFIPPRIDTIDTPPPSDQDEDCTFPKAAGNRAKALPPTPTAESNPTPASSPEMVSGRQSRLTIASKSHESALVPLLSRDSLNTILPRNVSLDNDLQRASQALQAQTVSSLSDSVLKEPNFGEFLTLSDDDIAESRPSSPDHDVSPAEVPLPASPHTASPAKGRRVPLSPPSPPPSQAPPLLLSFPSHFPTELATPSTIPMPPLSRGLSSSPSPELLASHASACAAFEATRIAAKYGFDLVYLVNLWPKHTASVQDKWPWIPDTPPRTPTRSLAVGDTRFGAQCALGGSGSRARMSQLSPLQARYLAAYGLATVAPPFYLCGSTHLKILNATEWMEFRRPEAKENDFVRGYGCAFFPSHMRIPQQQSTEEDCDADTEGGDDSGSETPKATRQDNDMRDSDTMNRGLVFVAYKKRKPDGSDEGCIQDQLQALHRDAETLVEKILDFHLMQRRREQLATLRARLAAETPPESLTAPVGPVLPA